MRAFTVSYGRFLDPGIWVEPQGLILGQEGYGGVRVIVPMVPPPTEKSRFDRLAVGMTPAGPVLLPGPRDGHDNRILVAFIGDPGYVRGVEYSIRFPDGVVPVAIGRGAYGEEDLCGWWEEALVILPWSAGEISIRYKYGNRFLRWGGGRDVRILTPEEAAEEAAASAASHIRML